MVLSYLISKIVKKMHLPSITNSEVHRKSKVCSGSHVVLSIIDKYSYVGSFSTIVNTNVGKYCSIADNCIIGGANHPIDWVSTSPVFHEGKNVLKKNFSNHPFFTTKKTEIGNDVWIGNNCLIKSGVRIHDGAIIGMGSVVTKDVGEYEIWAGNPAKLIRKRFSDQKIKKLSRYKWWEMEEEKLSIYAEDFNNLELFLERIKL